MIVSNWHNFPLDVKSRGDESMKSLSFRSLISCCVSILKSIESQLFPRFPLEPSHLKDASSHPHSVLIRQATVNPLPDDESS